MTAGWQGGVPSTTAVQIAACGHCGRIHGAVCSRVKAIEYYPDGRIKRVEYVAEQAWPSVTTTPTISIETAPIEERGGGLRARLVRGSQTSRRLR